MHYLGLEKYNDLLSVGDLAKIFGVSKTTIYKELNKGRFGTPFRIGRAYKIPKVYIQREFLQKHE